MMKRRQILEALTYALQNTDSQIQASLLTEIVDYLPQDIKEKVLQKALVAVKSIERGKDCINALKSLIHKLPPDLLPEALAIGKTLPSEFNRVRAITEIVDYLPQDTKEEVLQKTLVAIKSIGFDENFRLNALEKLVDKLPPNLLPEAFAIGKALPSGINRVQALKVLAPHLSPDLLLEALNFAKNPNLNTKYTTALALSALADKLPETLRTEVVSEALAAAESLPSKDFRDNVYRSGALTAVGDVLPETLQAEVLQKALDSAKAVEEEWCRSISLADLAPMLPEALQAEVLREALDAIKGEEGDWATATALLVLIPKLPPDLLPEALAVAKGLHHESYRVQALTAIAPHLSSELLPEAFSIVDGIRSKSDRLKILIVLASQMSKMPKDELLPLWQTMRHSLWLSLSKQDFAHHMLALAAVIYAIGGQESVVETLIEIQDVERW
ncbi:MAG: hypothetical protein RLZZ574_3530 [Cyanobacteriota bacterium]